MISILHNYLNIGFTDIFLFRPICPFTLFHFNYRTSKFHLKVFIQISKQSLELTIIICMLLIKIVLLVHFAIINLYLQ